MKLLFAMSFILGCVISNAQSSDTSLKGKQIQYEKLMTQRNNQRTTGLFLWAAGEIIGAFGAFYLVLSFGENNTAGVVMVTGMGMVVTGAGLLVSSWIKKKKAKALLKAGISKIEFYNRSYIAQHSVGISIAL